MDGTMGLHIRLLARRHTHAVYNRLQSCCAESISLFEFMLVVDRMTIAPRRMWLFLTSINRGLGNLRLRHREVRTSSWGHFGTAEANAGGRYLSRYRRSGS